MKSEIFLTRDNMSQYWPCYTLEIMDFPYQERNTTSVNMSIGTSPGSSGLELLRD